MALGLQILLCCVIPASILLGLLRFRKWKQARIDLRAPVETQLLRAPGESLQKKIEDLDDKLGEALMSAMLLPPVTLLLLAVWHKGAVPQRIPELIGFYSASVAAFAFYARRVFKLRDEIQNHSLGLSGERAVGEELNKLMLDGCFVYHDFPADPKWNIDHVIVAPSGVYIVETKTRRKRKAVAGKRDHELLYDGEAIEFPHDERSRYGLDQAVGNAKWLSGYLSSATGEKVWVQPILTFPGWFIINRVPPGNSLAVLAPKQIRPYVLKSGSPTLTAASMERIKHQLEQKCRDVEF
ncbi:MAG: nuclease-related domain-containing protein [Verrucomicrobiota bacterium]